MRIIAKIYINEEFVTPHGTEVSDLINPSVNQVIGHVTLGDEIDTRMAIAAAKVAFGQFSMSSIKERIRHLQRLHDAILKRVPTPIFRQLLHFLHTSLDLTAARQVSLMRSGEKAARTRE